jgi:hypothetical protein
MVKIVGRVNNYFQSNDFNDLAMREFRKTGEIHWKIACDFPMISITCQ